VTEDPTTDPDFTFGLERILDGVAVAIARAAARSVTRGSTAQRN
jgi:hypothetical protein